ncbi:hypothetical protein [Cupriavidus pauculus]|uniref:hypothetical protein n=1 Tax=Cupriavidus pauculus TaxID=82633 RepID=UPI001FD53465|nr:hypothetical protein [Cupriavidus pauculus]
MAHRIGSADDFVMRRFGASMRTAIGHGARTGKPTPQSMVPEHPMQVRRAPSLRANPHKRQFLERYLLTHAPILSMRSLWTT